MRMTPFKNRAPRVDLKHPALLIDSNGLEIAILILDLSSGGFRISLDQPLRIGEFVSLRVDRCEDWLGQIRWTLGAEAGGIFTGPVDYSGWR